MATTTTPESSLIGEIFSMLIGTWKEIFLAFWGFLPKVFSFVLWALLALFILPCVFVAGNIYPKWVEWGEGF